MRMLVPLLLALLPRVLGDHNELIEEGLALYTPVSSAVEGGRCRRHGGRFRQGVRDREPWALNMLDASSKLPAGLLRGNLIDLGNYDQCLDVRFQPHNDDDDDVISGQLCLVSLGAAGVFSELKGRNKIRAMVRLTGGLAEGLDAKSGNIEGVVSEFGATVALCIPSSCVPRDIERHLQSEMRGRLGNISVRVHHLACSSKNDVTTFTRLDWFAVIFLGSYACFIFCCTLTEIFAYKGPHSYLTRAFSLGTNTRRLFSMVPSRPDHLPALNGIRLLSTLWILLMHHISTSALIPSTNLTSMTKRIYDWRSLIVTNATVFVDTFLLLSGLLTSYFFLIHMNKGRGFNVALYFLHRYTRLTPPYAATMLLASTVATYLGDGPLWKANMASNREPCEKNWIYGLLFINNYYPGEQMCLDESWYLSVDTQLFCLAPLLLYPLWRWPRLGKMLLGALMVGGLTTAFAVSYINKYPFTPLPTHDAGAYGQHFATHTRITPWLIGIALGYLLHATKVTSPRLPRGLVTAAWILSMTLLLTAILPGHHFFQPDYVYDRMTTALYTSLMRPLWALGVAWIVFACVRGHAVKLNTFLSSPFIQMLSRLCYAIYLTNISVFIHLFATTKTTIYLDDLKQMTEFFGVLVLCFVVATILHLMFEAPAINIERILYKKYGVVNEKNDKKSS